MANTLVSASILNGDLAHLAETADQVQRAGADALHYDVMDGSFVDNLSFGIPVLEKLRPCTDLTIDVHLMIVEPLRFISRFAKAGADMISFHVESRSDPAETIRAIHACGIPAGLAVSPDTPVDAVDSFLPLMQADDFILMMTVYPGLGGQQFIPAVLPKLEELRKKPELAAKGIHIEVDGGINAETAALCRAAGADYLVAGSYLLNAADPAEAVRLLRG